VTALVEHIERKEEWGSLPILADALQDAGLDDAELLSRLRHDPGPPPEKATPNDVRDHNRARIAAFCRVAAGPTNSGRMFETAAVS
jgi:hypothetical protein